MAGHSKFKNIMHRKGAQDKKRAKIFTKIIRDITIAAKLDNGEGPRLNLALKSAKDANMPKDTIEKAIKRGIGGGDVDSLIEINYEGYGPNGIAVMVQVLTDNKNKSASEVRNIFNKNGGNLGESNSVSYLFNKSGFICIEKEALKEQNISYDNFIEKLIEIDVTDILEYDDYIEVLCPPEKLHFYINAINKMSDNSNDGIRFSESKIAYIPILKKDVIEKQHDFIIKFLTDLLDNDSVQEVFHDANI